MSEIIIPLSKKKIAIILLGSLLFVFIGVWGIIDTERFVSIRYSETVVFYSGIIAVLFFGICFFFALKKIFSSKPGLIISNKGVFDNSNANSIGLIEWKDITGIERLEIASSKMLLIKTSNPEKYINSSKNLITKKTMRMNYKMYGSPIAIISNSLKINFSNLENLLNEELKKRDLKTIN